MTILEKILNIKEIQEGIQSDLGNIAGIDDITPYIHEAISLKQNIVSIKVYEGKGYDFECSVHEDNKKGLYLLESRLFESETGAMVNGYLMVLNKDLEVDPHRYEDVWEVADWKEIT